MKTNFRFFTGIPAVIIFLGVVFYSCNHETSDTAIQNLITDSTIIGEVLNGRYVVTCNETELLAAFEASAEDSGLQAHYSYVWIGESNPSGQPVSYAVYARNAGGSMTAAAGLVLSNGRFRLDNTQTSTITCSSSCAQGCAPVQNSDKTWTCSSCTGQNSTGKVCSKTITKTIN